MQDMEQPDTKRPVDQLLAEYGESHQDETNKAIHWVCVPLIVWTIIALLWSIPSPFGVPLINWATLTLAASLGYYMWLSPPLAVGFAVFAAACVGVILAYTAITSVPLWQTALIVFVIAWIGQFWGHKVEGKKPSFFKDIQFLMIGPAWLMSFLYRKLGIRY
ncbi:MAG: Mpo1-like protein [Pseudomonadota bacterium]